MDNIRQQRMVLFFGTNGTGKTTLMLNSALDYLEQNLRYGKRVLCCLPDDSERKYDKVKEILPVKTELESFRGIRKIMVEDRTIFETIRDTYTGKDSQGFNGLAVMDDLGGVLNRRPEEALKLLKRRRQANMDMYWNFHTLTTDMPRSFLGYATDIVLLKTADSHLDTMNKLPVDKQKEFEEMYFRVQEKSKENKYYYEKISLRE